MASTPTSDNKTADIINTVLTDVEQSAVKVGEATLFAEIPALNVPVVKQIVDFLINFFAKYIYHGTKIIASDATIDTQTGIEEIAYANALAEYKKAIASGDKNAIKDSLAKLKEAALNLGHSDGSASI